MLKLLGVLAVATYASAAEQAVVVLSGNATGVLRFTQKPNKVEISGQVSGLTPGRHGFHIHALGDLSDGCMSTGLHFNPQNHPHGAPDSLIRHAGDLGNIDADSSGVAQVSIVDSSISLSGERSVIGRTVVIHALEDDLGRAGDPESLKIGNSGARVSCGIIGLA